MRAAAYLLSGLIACGPLPVTAIAQAIPLTGQAAADYRTLPDPSKAAADHLFYLMLYEQRRDLRGAIAGATALSTYRSENVKQYREAFDSAWIQQHLNPVRLNIIPKVPDAPETISDGEWSYGAFLNRSMQGTFTKSTSASDDLSFLVTAADLIPMAKSPVFQSVIEAAKLALGGDKSGTKLLSRDEVEGFYGAAIAAEEQAGTDPVLQKTLSDFIERTYGDKVTDLEAVGASAQKANADSASQKDMADAEIQRRQDEAITKIKGLIASENEPNEDESDPPPTGAPEDYSNTFNYKLGELEGGASVAIDILQFSDPEAARRATFYVNAASQVARLYNSFDVGEIGPWAFAGGYFNVALSVMNGAQESGEKAATMAMLQDLAKSIAALHKDMLANFQVVNSRFDEVIGLNVTSFARVEDALARLTELSTEGVEASQRIENASALARLTTAHDAYVARRDDALKTIDQRCAFLGAAATEQQKHECIRTIIVTLLLDSRTISSSANVVLLADSHPYLFDHASFADAYLSGELAGNYPSPRKLVLYGGSQVVVPAGLPDIVTWLAAIERLRWETEVNHLQLSPADRSALMSVSQDGMALAAALNKYGDDSTHTWLAYTQQYDQLESVVRDTIKRYRIVNIDQLITDPLSYCVTCKAITVADTDGITVKIAKSNAQEHIGGPTIFKDRAGELDQTRSRYSTTIAADAASVKFAPRISDGVYAIDYDSLPVKLKTTLGLDDLLALRKTGVLELAAEVSSIKYNDSLTAPITDRCGPVQGGSRCVQNAFITAHLKIFASTAPVPTSDQIIDAYKSIGIPLGDQYKAQFSGMFPTSRTYDLYNGDLTIDTPYPADGGDGHSVVIHRPQWPEIMAYIYRQLDTDGFKLDRGQDIQILRNDIVRADRRTDDLLRDISAAIDAGLSSPDSIPAFTNLQKADVVRLRDLAADTQNSFNRAAFARATNLYPNTYVEDWNAKCRVASDTVRELLDNRWWLELEAKNGNYLTTSDPADAFCANDRGGFFAPKPLASSLVSDWGTWASVRAGGANPH